MGGSIVWEWTQVDMIVCYDASASPGRNIQRMGRTGRHGNGRVVYILAAGKESNKYRTSLQVRAVQVVGPTH